MRDGLVSVMMPAYNAASYISEAIQSLINQTYSNWELIVVDDGSTDQTPQIAAQFTDQRIQIIRKENGGESSARNVALDHSQGEFIAYLDADDSYLPHHLAVTVQHLQSYPDHDGVYTDGHHIDDRGTRLKTLQARRRGPFQGRLFEHAVLASDIFGPPACVVLRHRLILEHHLRYDRRIVIGPDWDFFVRFTELGDFGYIDRQTCLYRVHQANITCQVNPARRNSYLALCRENAIHLKGFGACSPETRTAVFYDLLINLLHDQPERQTLVTGWREFGELPSSERARLLRLMTSRALTAQIENSPVALWLQKAIDTNPSDTRARLLHAMFKLSPKLCTGLIRARCLFQTTNEERSPFADLLS